MTRIVKIQCLWKWKISFCDPKYWNVLFIGRYNFYRQRWLKKFKFIPSGHPLARNDTPNVSSPKVDFHIGKEVYVLLCTKKIPKIQEIKVWRISVITLKVSASFFSHLILHQPKKNQIFNVHQNICQWKDYFGSKLGTT